MQQLGQTNADKLVRTHIKLTEIFEALYFDLDLDFDFLRDLKGVKIIDLK